MGITSKRLIMIGGSAGAYDIVAQLLAALPKDFRTPIVVILHRNEKFTTHIESSLANKLQLNITAAQDKGYIEENHIYFATPGYHLLIEPGYSFSLDISEPIEFSRPAINISFESAADVYGKNLTLFILSGANSDGAAGMAYAASLEAACYIQAPDEAHTPTMPQYALDKTPQAQIQTNKQLLYYFQHISTFYEKY